MILFIFTATVKLPADKFTGTGGQGESTLPEVGTETKKVILNSGEELYSELRDRNFNAVGPMLSRRAKTITAQFDVCCIQLTHHMHDK